MNDMKQKLEELRGVATDFLETLLETLEDLSQGADEPEEEEEEPEPPKRSSRSRGKKKPEPEPEEEDEDEGEEDPVTLEDLQELSAELLEAGQRKVMKDILAKHNVRSLASAPKKKFDVLYDDLFDAVEELGD